MLLEDAAYWRTVAVRLTWMELELIDWLFQDNETGSGDYASTAINSLKLVSIFCAKRISANESKKAKVDSAP
jgi:hypothetical protein